MKKLVLFSLMAIPIVAASGATKPAPTPPEYPIVIHVLFSRGAGPDLAAKQQLQTIINDQQVELSQYGQGGGVLTPGDYKARYFDLTPKRSHGYDVYGRYEFLMPDGATRAFDVTGLGSREGGNAFPSPSANK